MPNHLANHLPNHLPRPLESHVLLEVIAKFGITILPDFKPLQLNCTVHLGSDDHSITCFMKRSYLATQATFVSVRC